MSLQHAPEVRYIDPAAETETVDTAGELFAAGDPADDGGAELRPAPLFAGWEAPEAPVVELTPQAKRLYRLIVYLCRRGQMPYSFAGRQYMADKIGIGISQIGRYIAELKGAGRMRVEHRGNRNARYYPLAGRAQTGGQMRAQMRAQIAAPSLEQSDNKEQQQQSPIAAAVFRSADSPEIETVADALPAVVSVATGGDETARLVSEAARHLDRPTAERLIRDDPAGAAVVIPWCLRRIAETTPRPVSNPAGFIRNALTNPSSCGFQRDAAGRWQPLAPTGDAAAREARERAAAAKHQRDAERRADETRQRDADAAERRAADDAWTAAAPELREEIRRDVDARLSRLVDRDGPMFAAACAAEALRRQQARGN